MLELWRLRLLAQLYDDTGTYHQLMLALMEAYGCQDSNGNTYTTTHRNTCVPCHGTRVKLLE